MTMSNYTNDYNCFMINDYNNNNTMNDINTINNYSYKCVMFLGIITF